MYDNLVNYQQVTHTFFIYFFGIGNLKMTIFNKKKLFKYMHTNNLEQKSKSNYTMKNFEFY